jgi:hypothetical protein
MTGLNFSVRTCDRCHWTPDPAPQQSFAQWGKIYAEGDVLHIWQDEFFNGAKGRQSDADICPKCVASLNQWWQQRPTDGR